ncbi:hypothetical protein TSUD_180130 [Trifolium subterraneum]|uniref:Uncharacterized protein n=1 Tax=Trifolium subterraneum TaxID=3900 RepID=A0A2Z6PLE5_TRISU|nr:hypothetical protein TSUD_180130 [Trifolium subterraneum]
MKTLVQLGSRIRNREDGSVASGGGWLQKRKQTVDDGACAVVDGARRRQRTPSYAPIRDIPPGREDAPRSISPVKDDDDKAIPVDESETQMGMPKQWSDDVRDVVVDR